MSPEKTYKANDIGFAIHIRHPRDKGWIVRDEVSDQNGRRRIDHIAFHAWNSPHAVCYEVKVTRGDWTKECFDLNKRALVEELCAVRYFVAPKGIIARDELPGDWGLIEVIGRPEEPKLRTAKRAPRQNVPDLPKWIMRTFWNLTGERDRLECEVNSIKDRPDTLKQREEALYTDRQELRTKQRQVEEELRRAESMRRKIVRLACDSFSHYSATPDMTAKEVFEGMQQQALKRILNAAKEAKKHCDHLVEAAEKAEKESVHDLSTLQEGSHS